jgi:branched-chain amino acid transport system ATP-binding protein
MSTDLVHDTHTVQVTSPALVVANLVSGYAGTTVLRDVSMEIPAGSVVAVLGANGAGKSTLLKTISGLVRPARGTVAMNGVDVTKMAPHRRAALGLCHIPEGRAIFRSLTVRENIHIQAERCEEDAAVDRVLEAFPALRDRLSQQAGTMSGGQQQMLAVGRAYVRDPKLILVDEASLGLAPKVVDAIFTFLEDVTKRGAALLIVDQFVSRALAMASTAYVLRRGRIVFSGNSAELLEGDLFNQYIGTD